MYENDTGEIDTNGLPPHSITCVVEGGDDLAIANAIFIHKGPGCYTNGTSSINVTDETGQETPIRFSRPAYIDIVGTVNIKQINGYTTATTDAIKKNLQDYLDSMDIGSNLAISSLWGIALMAMPSLANPMYSITSITASRLGDPQGSSDINMKYNEVCRGNINNITANVS